MKAQQLKETLHQLTRKQLPIFIWGAPGVGKSSIVKQVAKEQGIGFIDLRLALMDPTDLKGIPYYDPSANTALWAQPAFLPKDGSGILFLDELNTAAPSVQASAYQLILDRAIGEYKLPDGWAIVAAGNRQKDRGATYNMATPLANRFVHLDLEVSLDAFKTWAYANGIDLRVIAYLEYKSEDLFSFDPTQQQHAFATPRSWEYVSQVLSTKLSEQLLFETICGAIGNECATSFFSFIAVMDQLPDLEAILDGSFTQSIPDDMEVYYALCSGLVSHYVAKPSQKRLENLIDFTMTIHPEFAVMIIQDLQHQGVDMEHLPSFERWVEQFSYLLE